jgi:hypothetical protein
MAHDPINPIAAEFGESGEPIIPVKPIPEIETSEAFKKEMAKKSTIVNEKESQDTRSQNQEQKELITIKPLTDEHLDTAVKSKIGSILDTEKPQSTKERTPTQTTAATAQKTTAITTSSDTSTDLSQGDSQLSQKLPEAPLPTAVAKPHVQHVAKKMAPPPLTTPKEATKVAPVEKKQVTSVQSNSSSGQGDTSSKQKEPSKVLPKGSPEVTTNQTTQKPAVQPSSTSKQAPTITPTASPPTAQSSKPITKEPALTTHVNAPKTEPQITSTASSQENKEVEPLAQTPSEAPSSLQQGANIPSLEPMQAPEKQDLSPSEMAERVTPFEVAPPVTRPSQDIIRTSKEDLDKVSATSPVQPPPESDFSGSGKDQGSKEKQDLAASAQNLLNTMYPTDSPNSLFKEAIGFDRLSPQILDLFDRIVGVLTVLQMQGKTETTIHLNEQQSPLLQGAEVVLSQVSTAPGSYNIELRGPPQTVALFQDNLEQLKKAFQRREEENKAGKKEFNFKINDIRISLKD